jgi:SAM-dependent methyltransferase
MPSMKLNRKNMDGAAKNYGSRRAFQIKFLKNKGLKKHHRLLDIGCGNLRGGVPIIQYLEPGKYCGLDVRKIAIDDGRLELKEKKLLKKKPELKLIRSLGDTELDGEFDVVWAFSVIFHLSDKILDECFGLVSRVLSENGWFCFNPNIGTQSEQKNRSWLEFPVVYRTTKFYEEMLAKHGLYIWDIGFHPISREWLMAKHDGKQDSQDKRIDI